MDELPCPYLGGVVEWSAERARHVAERHPDLMPVHKALVWRTVADPDQIRRNQRVPAALLFSKWYPEISSGKHVVVVVMSEPSTDRHWVVTAYMASRLAGGEAEWTRS